MLTCAEYARKALHFGIGFKHLARTQGYARNYFARVSRTIKLTVQRAVHFKFEERVRQSAAKHQKSSYFYVFLFLVKIIRFKYIYL